MDPPPANVSSNAVRNRRARRLFGWCVRLSCGVACVLQVAEFLKIYRSHPSSVDIRVSFLDEVVLPAVTICNANWFKRSSVCRNFPELCHNKSSTQEIVVNRSLQVSLSLDQFRSLGHGGAELVRNCSIDGATSNAHDFCSNTDWFVFKFRTCFVHNGQWRRVKSGQPTASSGFRLTLWTDAQPEESLCPECQASVLMYVHNRFALPSEEGTEVVILQPGFKHLVSLTMSTIQLLGYPFRPYCTDYRAEWKSEGQKGPLSKEGCLRACANEVSRRTCGCVRTYPLVTTFDANVKCLTNDQNECYLVGSREDRSCQQSCLPDCQYEMYEIITMKDAIYENKRIRSYAAYPRKSNFEDGLSMAELRLQTRRHIHYVNKPQFTPVEILGYVGGYLSLWLGVSIPLVYGLLERAMVRAVNILTTTTSSESDQLVVSVRPFAGRGKIPTTRSISMDRDEERSRRILGHLGTSKGGFSVS